MATTVRVAQGILQGYESTTKFGKPLVGFLSIPYAHPPVGELRFQPPQPPIPWLGARDATEQAPVGVQEDFLTKSIIGQEDCLYLNVYTTQLPSGKGALQKPVMVWIHGGGFTLGSGNQDIYGADYLIDCDVVVVTINYRLGVLGFLSLGNEAVPGNMGLKDQIAALRWIKENIEVFGGDPNNVTIFGESAGSASVTYLLLSPLSKGLFQKAIAQSGSFLNPWAFSLTNRERAFRLGALLGCKTTDDAVLLKFLMQKDPKKLAKAALKLNPQSVNMTGIRFPFVPTIETISPNAFLSEHPLQALRAGHFHHVPLIAGITSREGMITLAGLKDESWGEMNSKLENQLPEKLLTLSKAPASIIAMIKEFYFNNKPLSKDSVSQFIDFQSDLNFVEGVHTTLKYITALSSESTYFYTFSFDGALDLMKQVLGMNMKGACHGAELGYIFRSYLMDLDVEPSSLEMKTMKRIVKLWTNFAKFGNPTPSIDEDIPVIWKPYSTKNLSFLNIGTDLIMDNNIDMKRIKFWDNIYKSKL